MKWFQESWGGSLTSLHKASANKSAAWIWQTSGENAASFLRWIKPHSLTKLPQIDAALDWFDTREPRARDSKGRVLPMSDEQYARNLAATELLKSMKSPNKLKATA